MDVIYQHNFTRADELLYLHAFVILT